MFWLMRFWFAALLSAVVKFANDFRIEKATREYVGATLTGEQIGLLVKKAFPGWNGGVYASDCAGMKDGNTFTFRGKTQYNDLVLEYLGPNTFKVLPDESIVRKPRSGRGRGTTRPKTEAEITAELAAIKATLPQAQPQPPAPAAQGKGQSKGKDGGATA
jgi:hypothetical protein